MCASDCGSGMQVTDEPRPRDAGATRDPLDFLVIGAQKSATSWLYRCLALHPELHLPAAKRETEYLGGELHEQKGTAWYFSLMSGAARGQKRGDVSVEYMVNPVSPELVHAHAPKVRLIASLREPVSRAVSAYYWRLRNNRIGETDMNEGLARALHLCERAPTSSLVGQNWYYRDLLLRGVYAPQLDRYLVKFAPEQICVLFYDEIAKSPSSVAQTVYRFLGVRTDFVPRELDQRPKRNTYDRRLVWLQRRLPRLRIVKGALDRANRWLAEDGARAPALDADLQDSLSRYFAPHNQTLKRLLHEAASAGAAVAHLPAWL